jgi:hypothetical protein
VHRWDGFATHDDWHLERAVAAIRSAAEVPGGSEVAEAFAAAIAKQGARERVGSQAERCGDGSRKAARGGGRDIRATG